MDRRSAGASQGLSKHYFYPPSISLKCQAQMFALDRSLEASGTFAGIWSAWVMRWGLSELFGKVLLATVRTIRRMWTTALQERTSTVHSEAGAGRS